MPMQKFSRPGVILMATVVAIITSMVAANATQTIIAPNAVFISYNLAANGNSAPITPATNRSVLVMGCCTTGVQGVGQVSLLHNSLGGMTWVGLNSFSGASITSGNNNTAGTHIVYIAGNGVDIQLASANTILVHNAYGGPVAGNVTLVW